MGREARREEGGGMWKVERGGTGRVGGWGRKAEEERGRESGWRKRGRGIEGIDDTDVVLCPQELANWFIDCPRDRMKSAMSQLLIEILLPVAAVISLETTLPAVKTFVNILYTYCLEQAKKPRHVLVRTYATYANLCMSYVSSHLRTYVRMIGCCCTTLNSSHACMCMYVRMCVYACMYVHM